MTHRGGRPPVGNSTEYERGVNANCAQGLQQQQQQQQEKRTAPPDIQSTDQH